MLRPPAGRERPRSHPPFSLPRLCPPYLPSREALLGTSACGIAVSTLHRRGWLFRPFTPILCGVFPLRRARIVRVYAPLPCTRHHSSTSDPLAAPSLPPPRTCRRGSKPALPWRALHRQVLDVAMVRGGAVPAASRRSPPVPTLRRLLARGRHPSLVRQSGGSALHVSPSVSPFHP